MDQNKLINLTAEIVSAHVNNNSVAISDIPTLMRSVFGAFAALAGVSGMVLLIGLALAALPTATAASARIRAKTGDANSLDRNGSFMVEIPAITIWRFGLVSTG